MINRAIKRPTTSLNLKQNKKILFFVILFLLIIVLFKNAFRIGFFRDDYFFLKISRVSSLAGFLNFFSPFRTYSFKPLTSEVFYFFLSCFKYNTFVGHIIVFSVYFVGLVYFFKIIKRLTNNHLLSYLATFMYGVSFTHVFQLYWFATFQEIMLFTALSISFDCFLDSKYFFGLIAFIVALLSKETATLFVPFLIVFEIFFDKKRTKNKKKALILYIVLAGLFYLVYQYSLKYVTSLENYKIQIGNLRLVVNNSLWYLLWSVGVPNFMPDVMRSIFSKPLPVFKEYLKSQDVRTYFYLLIAYVSSFLISWFYIVLKNKQEIKRSLSYFIFSLVGFLLFLGPILFFSHRWMVRLMMPLLFISLFQGYILSTLYQLKKTPKFLFFIVIAIYLVTNYFGIKVHESSSVYLLENKIYQNSRVFFKNNENKLNHCHYLFFADNPKNQSNPWGGSKKLKNSFWGQYFIDYYFPNKKIEAVFHFESATPSGACIIKSTDLLEGNNY